MIKGLSLSRSHERLETDAIPAGRVLAIGFCLSFPLLAYHCAPGVVFHDSGEFSMAVASAGIPHSPGAPTWVILNLIFKMFCFGADAARSANLFSAFCGSLTIAFSSTFVYRLFGDRPRATKNFAALITALGLLSCGAFLEQSFMAEQYTLMTAIMSSMLLVLQSNEAKPHVKWLFALGLLFGLAIGNHPSQVVLGPLLLSAVIQNRKSLSVWKMFGLGFLGLALGLMVYLWLPIRSATNPLMNWGHPSTWKQFVWSISRQQWGVRGMSEAPTGFIKEWIKSFNFMGEMGFVTLACSLCGIVLSLRRAPRPLMWLFWLVVPYAIILMLGHIRQEAMDLAYIHNYGVRDWHIPLYMALSIVGAMGVVWLLDMRHKVTEKARFTTMACVSGLLLVNVPIRLSAESMHGFDFPKFYSEGIVSGVEKGAVIFTFNDNSNHTVGYQHYISGLRKDVYYGFGMPQMQYNFSKKPFNFEQRMEFMRKFAYNVEMNPLSIPMLTVEEVRTRPFYTEFTTNGDSTFADYLLPAGWVYKILDRKVTNEEALDAFSKHMKEHPEFYQTPEQMGIKHPDRLTREAMSYVHMRRGIYLSYRRCYKEAIDALELARKWEPNGAPMLFALGAAYDGAKEFVKAEDAYLDAIDLIPDFPGPRQNLAVLYFLGKDYDLAEKYAREELVITKGDKSAQKLLDVIAKERRDGRPAAMEPKK